MTGDTKRVWAILKITHPFHPVEIFGVKRFDEFRQESHVLLGNKRNA